MKRHVSTISGIAAIVLLIVVFVVGCSKSDHAQEAVASEHMNDMSTTTVDRLNETGEMTAGSVASNLFEAEELYQCPMHPEVITGNAEARCSKCGMNLEQMTDEEISELKELHSKVMEMESNTSKSTDEKSNCEHCNKR